MVPDRGKAGTLEEKPILKKPAEKIASKEKEAQGLFSRGTEVIFMGPEGKEPSLKARLPD